MTSYNKRQRAGQPLLLVMMGKNWKMWGKVRADMKQLQMRERVREIDENLQREDDRKISGASMRTLWTSNM